MTIANINRFIQLLSTSFDALKAQVSDQQVEHMAVLIHSAMESPRRHYHCSDHALHMCEGMNPRQVLAASFHDIVYIQLDDGFPSRVAYLLNPVARRQGDEMLLRDIAPGDSALQLCLDIFGFQPGQALPLLRGMNEFLSAVVATRLLQPHLSQADLIAIIACIEATVPFRAPEADGRDCSQVLAERVRAQARMCLGGSDAAQIEAFVAGVMADAVSMANRDVGGFAEPNPARFVSATWLLIEESNAPLASVGVYTLQDYREALSRMQGFLDSLKAERVFSRYAGQPSDTEFARLTAAAGTNIGFATAFLRLKITSISIIEALARATGGNGPVSMFLGDIRSSHGKPERIEDYLPTGPDTPGLDAQILQVLEKGRPEDSKNDLTISPLTAYMYRCLGPAACDTALANARRMVANEITPLAFLETLAPAMVGSIIDACARIAISRGERLQLLKAQLP
ncbi:MAG: hypothetical protein HXX19_06615 [Rhodoferax sp.]|nr:hypothetical protein [Rhodoferax sp.]